MEKTGEELAWMIELNKAFIQRWLQSDYVWKPGGKNLLRKNEDAKERR